MSLLDSTYFANVDCSIPEGTYNTIDEHIERYERDILIQVLGYDLYKLVAAYDSGTSPQRIIDIVEGKEYTVGSYTVKWNGILNSEKISFLAYYIFMKWIENTISVQNVGVVANVTENGVVISPAQAMQAAGMKARRLIGYPGNDAYAESLYNFLLYNESTYPEWLFSEFKPPNAFDL